MVYPKSYLMDRGSTSELVMDHPEPFQSVTQPVVGADFTIIDENCTSSAQENASSSFVASEQDTNELNIQESVCSNFFDSPDGIRYWIPNVDSSHKPVKDMIFAVLDDAIVMYQSYAAIAGFDIRLSTTKRRGADVTHKFILCSRAGKPNCQKGDSTDVNFVSKPSRSSNYKVTNCKARIKLKALKGSRGFILYEFVEAHNHPLVDVDNMDLTRKRRRLGFSEKEFIHKLNKAKIGPTVAFRLQSVLKGGQHMVHGTKTEFKNFGRDLRAFIGPRDAAMVVHMMDQRVINLENFSCEYIIRDGELRSLFWVDEVSKCNYRAFGDVLAFDATYNTNQYKMIFVPFTGVDHHKKCVTFGAGLLYDETIESYKWLLDSFLKAHVNQPKLVLTDQDPSMKQAISTVFNQSIHRLCMWHVMDKLPSKVAGDVLQNTNLRRRIHKLVWNVFITPTTFEERWELLMNDCNLKNHKWLSSVYSIREQWVPGYFRDIPMCCLMKTTSRCESSNARFKVYSSASNTLVQFMSCFDTAIDDQRYQQRKLEHETNSTFPVLHTPLPIEKHASLVYTRSIFVDVQKEISESLLSCMNGKPVIVDGCEHYSVSHFYKRSIVGDYKVIFNILDGSFTCSCMLFTRIGFICRHIFSVFRFRGIDKIPDKYIASRWKKNALPKKVFSLDFRYGVDNSESFELRSQLLDLVQQCGDRLRANPVQLASFVQEIKVIKDRIFEQFPNDPTSQKKGSVFEEFFGHNEVDGESIVAPQGIRNKGCGKTRRLIGPGEKAKKKKKKKKRKCNFCGKLARHDSRNCPKKKGIECEEDTTSTDDESYTDSDSDSDSVSDSDTE